MEMENNLTNGKYIIYLTLNTVNKKIYVGYHYTEQPYGYDSYLGCGVVANRPSTYKRANTPFQAAVKKYGPKSFIRTTLFVVDTLQEALKWEELIVNEEFVKRRDTYNVALGGGLPAPNNIELFQYDLNGNFIKCWRSSVEASKYFNISSNHFRDAVISKNTAAGYFWTHVLYDKLDITEYKTFIKKEYVYKFDKCGVLIKKYNTVRDAAKDSNSTERLILRALSEKTKSKGFYYSYDENFIICNSTYNKLTNVYLYNLDGTFYKEFSSPRECADFFGDVKTSRIYSAVRSGGLYKGLQISREKVPFMKNVSKCNEKRKVLQFDLSGNLIKEWDSIESAFKEYGPGVKRCLKGLVKKTKNFVFKFKE